MEHTMDRLQKQMLDDVFDAFTMLAGGNYVSLMHMEAGFTRYSPGAVELFGLPGEYIPNGAYNWSDYVHPEDRKRYLDAMVPLTSGEAFTYDLTYRVRTKEGSYVSTRQVGAVLRGNDGRPSLIGGMIVNEGVTDNTDAVTILPGRAGCLRDLDALLSAGKPVAALLLGIRRLGEINLRYGFSYGNRVLQEAAWLIQEKVHGRGRVYRMDGPTFVILMENHSAQELAAVYDSLRLTLQRGVRVDGVRHNISTCGGLVSTEGRHTDAAAVYACLRAAFRESRNHRYGELVDFYGSTNFEARTSLEMVSVIRDCIVEGCRGFSLCYQPVYAVADGAIIGAETLLRWSDETYGEVRPGEFLPVLENDFVFEELGSWLLRKAMEETLPLLVKRPNFLLGVNLSPCQLEDEYFSDTISELLRETGFPAKNLCLELTRGCRLLGIERLREIVESLQSQGIATLIDDFGSGFDSIGALRSLRSDYVKFDPSLMRDIEENQVSRETVGHLAALAALHGTRVCLKGVSTPQARDCVRNYAVYALQGSYFSDPLPQQALYALMK